MVPFSGHNCFPPVCFPPVAGLKVRELAKAEELATEHRDLIIERWNEHFNR
jgi:hypothetical protein